VEFTQLMEKGLPKKLGEGSEDRIWKTSLIIHFNVGSNDST
jgi:hypothetical protein